MPSLHITTIFLPLCRRCWTRAKILLFGHPIYILMDNCLYLILRVFWPFYRFSRYWTAFMQGQKYPHRKVCHFCTHLFCYWYLIFYLPCDIDVWVSFWLFPQAFSHIFGVSPPKCHLDRNLPLEFLLWMFDHQLRSLLQGLSLLCWVTLWEFSMPLRDQKDHLLWWLFCPCAEAWHSHNPIA